MERDLIPRILLAVIGFTKMLANIFFSNFNDIFVSPKKTGNSFTLAKFWADILVKKTVDVLSTKPNF